MRKKSKKMIVMSMILGLGVILQVNTAEAALQSNPSGTPITANLNDWVYYTRQMQATGGTLGLTDSISDTDLTSSNKNLDIHMQKNTEYGAVAILSASAYGNPEKIVDGGTTTGNSSGVVMRLNGEWTASGATNTSVWAMQVAAKRYWNTYTADGGSAKKGDATGETAWWHGSSYATWLAHPCDWHNGQIQNTGLIRARGGSIFSYWGSELKDYFYVGFGSCDWYPLNRGEAYWEMGHYGRACVVVGTGI